MSSSGCKAFWSTQMQPGLEQLSSTAPPGGHRRLDTQWPIGPPPPAASFSALLTQTYADQRTHESKPVWAQQTPHSSLLPGLPTAAKRIELIVLREEEPRRATSPKFHLCSPGLMSLLLWSTEVWGRCCLPRKSTSLPAIKLVYLTMAWCVI